MKDWKKWCDYQLCYWYALEVEARKATLGSWVKSRGGKVCRIDINELGKWKGILRLIWELDLPKPGLKEIYTLMWLLREKSNTQGSEQIQQSKFTSIELQKLEEEVLAEVNRLGNK